MAYFTEAEIKDRLQKEIDTRNFSAAQILNESRRVQDSQDSFDIFLSHSSKDNDLIIGLKLILQDIGYSVYVDWNDPALDPDHVTPKTAEVLRKRMSQCKSLIYAFSVNASNSKWMPWELGYFDAIRNSRVAVLPIRNDAYKAFIGSEFIGLYFQVKVADTRGGQKAIWVHNGDDYVNYMYWLSGKQPYKHQ